MLSESELVISNAIGLAIQLLARVDQLESEGSDNGVEIPDCGQYVIRDGTGMMRVIARADEYKFSQIEALAILLSFDESLSLHFYVNDCSCLLSEWSCGKRMIDSLVDVDGI